MTDKQYDEIVNRTIKKAAEEYHGSTETSATQRLLGIVETLVTRVIAIEAYLVANKAETAALINAVNGGAARE